MRKSKHTATDDTTKNAAYPAARAEAQAKANATGADHGLEWNSIFKHFTCRMLPRKENRYGHELRVEVVSCEILERCMSGHGPLA